MMEGVRRPEEGSKFSYYLHGMRGWLVAWLLVSFTFNQTVLPGNNLVSCASILTVFAGFNAAKVLNQLRIHLLNTNNFEVYYPATQRFPTPLWATKFWINRAIRVLPIYFIVVFLSLPPMLAGFGTAEISNDRSFVATVLSNIIPVNSWFVGLLGPPLTLSLWFIQNMILFWLISPVLYVCLSNYDDLLLLRIIQAIYWAQLIIPLLLFTILAPHTSVFYAFVVAVYSPYFHQLSVFIAGFCVGIIQMRVTSDEAHVGSWHADLVYIFPWCALCGKEQRVMTKQDFAAATNLLSYFTMSQLIIGCILSNTIKQPVLGYPMSVWMALLVPTVSQYATLCNSLSLYRSDQLSVTSQAAKQFFFQHFGRISFPLFMLFPIVMMYVEWLMNGSSINWPVDDDCDAQYHILSPFPLDASSCSSEWQEFVEKKKLTALGLVIVIVVSVLIATIVSIPLEYINRFASINSHFLGSIGRQEQAQTVAMVAVLGVASASDDSAADVPLSVVSIPSLSLAPFALATATAVPSLENDDHFESKDIETQFSIIPTANLVPLRTSPQEACYNDQVGIALNNMMTRTMLSSSSYNHQLDSSASRTMIASTINSSGASNDTHRALAPEYDS